MSIVTISRGPYSQGKKVAESLSEELNYECISREILLEASNSFNIPEVKLVRALHDAPSIFDHFQAGKKQYLDYFKSAFYTHMLKDNIVYHGHAGHFFLQNMSHVLKVRLNAHMSDRIKEEIRRERCTEEMAMRQLKKDDLERQRWSMQMYGKDCRDSRLYDIVLYVDALSVPDIVDILAKTVRKEHFRKTEASFEELKKRSLEAGVKAMATSVSPDAEVQLVADSSVELSHLTGSLKNDAEFRKDFSDKVKEELHLDQVLFRDELKPYKDHINNFYNLDVH